MGDPSHSIISEFHTLSRAYPGSTRVVFYPNKIRKLGEEIIHE